MFQNLFNSLEEATQATPIITETETPTDPTISETAGNGAINNQPDKEDDSNAKDPIDKQTPKGGTTGEGNGARNKQPDSENKDSAHDDITKAGSKVIKESNEESYDSDNDDDITQESGQDGAFFDIQLSEAIQGDLEVIMIVQEAQVYAQQVAKDYIMENAKKLVESGVLTENQVGQSFMVLSHDARRKKAESVHINNAARKANDPRYIKMMALRKKYLMLKAELHADSRYAGPAKTAVMQRQFRMVQAPNAQAFAARGAQARTQLR